MSRSRYKKSWKKGRDHSSLGRRIGSKNSGSSSEHVNDGPKEAAGERRQRRATLTTAAGLVYQDFTVLRTGSPCRTYANSKGGGNWTDRVLGCEPIIETDRSTREVCRSLRLIHEWSSTSEHRESSIAHLWTRSNIVKSLSTNRNCESRSTSHMYFESTKNNIYSLIYLRSF